MFLCVGEFKNKDVKTVSAHHLSGSNVCPILQRNLYKTRVIGQIFSRHRHWSIASTPPFRLYDLKKKRKKKKRKKKTRKKKPKHEKRKKNPKHEKRKKNPKHEKRKKKTPNTKNEKKNKNPKRENRA